VTSRPGQPRQPCSPASDEPRFRDYQRRRMAHWDRVARAKVARPGWGGRYHRRLAEVLGCLVPPGARVLELGCAEGDLLAALRPSLGVGIDFSSEMVARARRRHPELLVVQADAHALPLEGTFDFIILSDLVNDLWDVQGVLEQIAPLCSSRTRVVLNAYSRLWELPLALATRLGLALPNLEQNWLTVEDAAHLLGLAGLEVVCSRPEILWPLPPGPLAWLCDRVLVKLWPARQLALTNLTVARPRPEERRAPEDVVSIIVPTRNEAGNLPGFLERVPEMGGGTEVVFVEGGSHDDTYRAVERLIADHPDRRCQLLRQTGRGKGDAVRLGCHAAKGRALIILDADLTVPPEDLPRFHAALTSGRAEFVNGVRLVYPMERRAMRWANLVANKAFALGFTWVLGQPVKDTLCGTKAFWREDYLIIEEQRLRRGSVDPFGDFDLLLGAAELNLTIVDLPVRYRERVYGATNIQRWRDGWTLLELLLEATWRFKFV